MRKLIKYLLGIVIILTIIYTIFISYNVFVFINSDESKITIEDYSESMIIDSQKREALWRSYLIQKILKIRQIILI